ncbi:MAG: helix-turn-helix domain-containing protein [Chloroflexi bacterium]|nr:helix-turn-helix domain-containing protein [Chloroflexota bacterium]
MTRDEVVELLRKKIEKAGTQVAIAREFGVTEAYISDILHGKSAPGEKVLVGLGLRRVVSYVRRETKK